MSFQPSPRYLSSPPSRPGPELRALVVGAGTSHRTDALTARLRARDWDVEEIRTLDAVPEPVWAQVDLVVVAAAESAIHGQGPVDQQLTAAVRDRAGSAGVPVVVLED